MKDSIAKTSKEADGRALTTIRANGMYFFLIPKDKEEYGCTFTLHSLGV